jgi:glycosyltransferase involved in cell wall biosynthesis
MKFGFYSCMSGVPWGGSEELWWRAARKLQSDSHEITVNYKWWPRQARQLTELATHGANIFHRNQPVKYWLEKWQQVRRVWKRNRCLNEKWLTQQNPDMVLVTLGYHPDRIDIADQCIKLNIPYAVNVQCASSFFFIHSNAIDEYRRWYQNAAKVLFVSRENQNKIETNIAAPLNNAEIVANPFNINQAELPAWQKPDPVFRLACVGRFHFQSKGQDLLIEVMKQDKWRNRPFELHFYGHDQGNLRQFNELVQIHGLGAQMKHGGFIDNVNEIWAQNHGLILPSRYEGAPLVLIEAMMCNRLPIATDIGRNSELCDDGESGFIIPGATVDLIDQTLERAWQQRDQWQAMGELAGKHIRQRYTDDPVRDFADILQSIAQTKSQAKTAQIRQ